MEERNVKFETWALIELFGHNQLAGLVTEQVIAGQSFVRIDVPKTKLTPEFTKYHLPTAIYGLTPVSEDYAKRMAEKINAQPVNDYKHNEVINELIKEGIEQMKLKIELPYH